MRFLSKLALSLPKTILLFIVFTVVIASYLTAQIPFDFSTESLFVSDDPHRVTFQKFKEDFGNDDNFIFIAFRHPDLFTPSILKRIKRISDKLRKVNHIEESISLVDVIAAEDLLDRFQKKVKAWEKQLSVFGISSGEGKAFLLMADKVGIRPVIKELQKVRREADILNHTERLKILRGRILRNPLYLRNILSEDGTTSGIFLITSSQVTNNEKRSKLLGDIRKILERENLDKAFEFHLAGLPVVRTEYARLISRDHLTFIPIIIPIFILILFLIFKDFYQMMVPLLVIGASLLWTIGFMSLMGGNINIINNVIYVLLLVIGIATSIHVVNHYNTELMDHGKKKRALRSTIEHMGRACFFTCSTTAIGFLSLLVTDIRIIREFGLYSALGVMLIFLFASLIIPILLYFVPLPDLKAREKKLEHKFLGQILQGLANLCEKYPYYLLGMIVICLSVAAISTQFLIIDTHMLEEISSKNPTVVANHFVEKNLTGILPLEILLVEKEKGVFSKPEEQKRIDGLENFIAKQNWIVSKVISIIDVLKVANMVINDYDPKFNRVPKDKRLLKKILELEEIISQEERGVFQFTARHHTTLRISIRLIDAGSNAHFDLIKKIDHYIAQDPQFAKQYQIIYTGEIHMAAIVLKRLVRSMLRSIFLALGIIFFVTIILFQSFKISLISVIPNVLPIIFTLGVMSLSGIILRTSTVVIFSIALGIAVDDTIHYLIRYRSYLQKGFPPVEAMKEALTTTGKAMIWTTFVICSGLMVLGVSSFKATVDFGILGSVTLFSALLGDLILLPVLLRIFLSKKFPSQFPPK